MTIAERTSSTLDWGSGSQTLVFLHYFGGSAMSWQWVAAQMQGYRCIAINLPGFGDAPALESPSLAAYATAVTEELARLDIENYTLVGHSMGGKIALQVAISSDRPPRRVVLIAPSPPSQEPMPHEEKKRLLNNHPSQDNAKTTIERAIHQPLNRDQQTLAIETHIAVDNTAWRWWLLEGMDHSVVDQLSQLQVPVTVLASKDDPVIAFETIQSEVLGNIPSANLMTAQGVGHLLPLEAADWVADQLRQVA